jgi:hypothetical protein
VLAKRAVRRGRFKATLFWDLVQDVENQLFEAAQSGADTGDRELFEYKRLPRRDTPCELCARQHVACLVSFKTVRDSSKKKYKRGTYKCQLCYLRKAACQTVGQESTCGAVSRLFADISVDNGSNDSDGESEDDEVAPTIARIESAKPSNGRRRRNDFHTYTDHLTREPRARIC